MAAPAPDFPLPPSGGGASLKARLQAFLPEIAQANEATAARVAAGQDVRIDTSLREADDEEQGQEQEEGQQDAAEEEEPVTASDDSGNEGAGAEPRPAQGSRVGRIVEMNLALGEVDDAVAAALEGADEGETAPAAADGQVAGAVRAMLGAGGGEEKQEEGTEMTKRPKIEEL